jgi:MATE family multidrug resistance protein
VKRGHVVRDLVRLGWPVLVAQVAVMLYGVVDTIMAGRYSTVDLAAVGIGGSIYITVFVTMMGVLLALTPVAAQHFGAGRFAAIGEEVRQCMWLSVVLSLAAVAVLQLPEPFLQLTRAAPEVSEKVRAYLGRISLGVPALLFFRVFGSFTTAVSQPRLVMLLNLLGLSLKVPLTWLFMYGGFGLPAMGAPGCALATSVCAWVTSLLGWGYCARDPSYRRFEVFRHWSWPHWPTIRHLLGVGVPIGATFLVDVTAFTFMTLFIARLGATYSAAHQIAANFAALLFMVPLSLATAATVLVGQAIGARDFARARATGIQALIIGMTVAVAFSIALMLGRHAVAALYARDAVVQSAAAVLLGFVAVYHLADALQSVSVNVLRGYKRTVVPMLIYTGALWGIGLGGGYVLGLTGLIDLGWLGVQTPLGARGFWAAAIGSLLCAGGLVAVYFLRVSAKAMRTLREDREAVAAH